MFERFGAYAKDAGRNCAKLLFDVQCWTLTKRRHQFRLTRIYTNLQLGVYKRFRGWMMNCREFVRTGETRVAGRKEGHRVKNDYVRQSPNCFRWGCIFLLACLYVCRRAPKKEKCFVFTAQTAKERYCECVKRLRLAVWAWWESFAWKRACKLHVFDYGYTKAI